MTGGMPPCEKSQSKIRSGPHSLDYHSIEAAGRHTTLSQVACVLLHQSLGKILRRLESVTPTADSEVVSTNLMKIADLEEQHSKLWSAFQPRSSDTAKSLGGGNKSLGFEHRESLEYVAIVRV